MRCVVRQTGRILEGGTILSAASTLVPVGTAALWAAARVLRETRDATGPRPDALGAGALAACAGALALAIVEGPSWGWSSLDVVATLTSAVVLALFVARRSARHPAPIVEGALLRIRSFALACSAAVVFFIGFSAFLLASVFFLTDVWHESAIVSGLMLAPAPLAGTVVSIRSATLVRRIGHGNAAALGALLVGLANAWFLLRAGATPAYARELLPAQLVGGTGVGLVIPSLTGAATLELPSTRFATGTAVLSITRQIGMVLGVAVLVAILGQSTKNVALSGIRHGWIVALASALAAAAIAFAIEGSRHRDPAPVAAAPERQAEGCPRSLRRSGRGSRHRVVAARRTRRGPPRCRRARARPGGIPRAR